ncbi:MAG: hypothetical protein WA057_02990 [Candidatus Magasanikiibacteriota bacterium]
MSDTGPKSEQMTEDEIIREIVSRAETVSHRQMNKALHDAYKQIKGEDVFGGWENTPDITDENNLAWKITYGNKILFLTLATLPERPGEFKTHVISNLGSPQKMPDETTILYKAAKEIMTHHQTKSDLPCTYSIWTENIKMARWAINNGDKIFGWKYLSLTLEKNDKIKSTHDLEEMKKILTDETINNGEIYFYVKTELAVKK